MEIKEKTRYRTNDGTVVEVVYVGEGAEYPIAARRFYKTEYGTETWDWEWYKHGGVHPEDPAGNIVEELGDPTSVMLGEMQELLVRGQQGEFDVKLKEYAKLRGYEVKEPEPKAIINHTVTQDRRRRRWKGSY